MRNYCVFKYITILFTKNFNMDARFEGKHVLITGAARGIGYAIATHFAREGAALSLIDNHSGNLQQAKAELDKLTKQVHIYAFDIRDKSSIDKHIPAIDAERPVDILVNNAGIASEIPFLKITETAWKEVLDVNLTGMFLISQAVCRSMADRKRGAVINMSSKNGMDAEFGYAHYNASKAGVIMLTKTMAVELAHLGIRVNVVCPGYIQTPMSEAIDSPTFVKEFTDRYIPMDRPGTVDEVAALFLFLASEESSFITGQTFVVDGGQLAGQKPGFSLRSKKF
ncbi:MAG: SDR family NAD(P)-dependent oxidoreductase [Ginsengibacter sp.]